MTVTDVFICPKEEWFLSEWFLYEWFICILGLSCPRAPFSTPYILFQNRQHAYVLYGVSDASFSDVRFLFSVFMTCPFQVHNLCHAQTSVLISNFQT